MVADKDAVVGGTFTTNVMCAAPVLYCKDVMSRKKTTRVVRCGWWLAWGRYAGALFVVCRVATAAAVQGGQGVPGGW